MTKLSEVKGDKKMVKDVAHKALSQIMGKAGKPKSMKIKVKFGGSK